MLDTEATPSKDDPLLENSTEQKPITSPLVLQCLNCRTIVGDTCTIIDLNPNLRTVTLERKGEGAILDDTLHTSMTGIDYGSTYHLISCKKCNTILGRMYRTTSPELDLWRGHFTFSSDVLLFYELSAELAVGNFDAEEPIKRTDESSNNLEITKLQKFCLYLYDKVEKLEAELKALKIETTHLNPKPNSKTTVKPNPLTKPSNPNNI